MHVYVCTRTHIYTPTFICIYISILMYIYKKQKQDHHCVFLIKWQYIHTRTHTHTHTRTHTHTHTHTCIYTCIKLKRQDHHYVFLNMG